MDFSCERLEIFRTEYVKDPLKRYFDCITNFFDKLFNQFFRKLYRTIQREKRDRRR